MAEKFGKRHADVIRAIKNIIKNDSTQNCVRCFKERKYKDTKGEERPKATNTGYRSAAIVEGKESIALATGINSKAKGKIGCFIVLAEWKEINYEYHLIDVKSAKVDGENIKEDTFYMLKDGKFVEVD